MSLGFPSHAATWLDPSLKWRTIETPHFSIHFHDGLEDIARRFAPMAEEVHEELVPFMKHQPDLKTNVLLVDTVDFGNGFTSVIPDPRVTLYLTDWSTNLNPSKYDLWLKFVFLHEYVHVLHLDIVSPSLMLFRFIFGRVIFPNGIEPQFIIEGLATYGETKFSKWGRGWDPRWDMMMRMDVLEDNLKTPDQAAVSTVRWPMGNTSYLYGVKFLDYLAETYGEERLISLSHIYGDFLYTMGIDGAFIYLYRKNLKMLWNEWLDHLRKKYEKVRKGLGKVTEPELVTRTGYYNLKPKWDRDSRSVYYQQNGADGYPCIRRIDPESGRDQRMVETRVFASNLSRTPDNKLLFIKEDIEKNYYIYKDLYVYDPEKNRAERLSEGMRITDADISPDGSRIVFVQNKVGTKTLMMMTRDGSDIFTVCSPEADVQYFSPRWSPDGRRFVVAKWSPGGKQKLYLVDPLTGIQKRVTRDESLTSEANPVFSPDGEYIFYDSDRTGIVNLYALHLGTGRLFQITNVLGGAMMPDVSPDGKMIVYVSYSSRGYDIAVMDVNSQEWTEVSLSTSQPVDLSKKQVLQKTGGQEDRWTIHDYNPLPTLTPKFWIPYEYTNENGPRTSIYTMGTDILGHHRYILELGYDFDAERPHYSAVYANNQFLPQISLMATDVAMSYRWNGSTLWVREKYNLASLSFFDNRFLYEWDGQAFVVGYEQTNITSISSLETISPKPSLGNIKGVFLLWQYSNARRYAKSISSEDGINLILKVGMNSSDLGSDYTYTTYSGSAATYFKAPLEHHVLAPTLYGFYSRGDQLEQSNYSWRYLPLRGYPSTNLQGNKGAMLAAEYRFPLWYTETGFLYGYTFFDRVWGNLFYDVGGATFGPVQEMKLKRSYGAELNIDTLLFWYLEMGLKLGYVRGLDEDGEEKVYFTIGGSLEDILWYNRERI